MKKTTVTMTWERLAAMENNGNKLFSTPGDENTYWDSQKHYFYDEAVASPSDFEWNGIGFSLEDECDEVFSVEVELLGTR